jgi:hypothetical protein
VALTSALIAGAFVGYHIAMLALGGGLLTSIIAAAVGAAVLLFVYGQVIEDSPDQRVSRPSVAEQSNYSRRWCLLLACIDFS